MKRPLSMLVVIVLVAATLYAVPVTNPNNAQRARLLIGLIKNTVDVNGDIQMATQADLDKTVKPFYETYGVGWMTENKRANYLTPEGTVIPYNNLNNGLQGKYIINYLRYHIKEVRSAKVAATVSPAAVIAAEKALVDGELGAEE